MTKPWPPPTMALSTWDPLAKPPKWGFPNNVDVCDFCLTAGHGRSIAKPKSFQHSREKNNERALGTFFCVGKVVVFSISFDVRLLDFQMFFSPNFVFLEAKHFYQWSPKVPSSFEQKTGGHSGVTTNPKQCKNEVVVHSKSTIDLHLPFDPPQNEKLNDPYHCLVGPFMLLALPILSDRGLFDHPSNEIIEWSPYH